MSKETGHVLTIARTTNPQGKPIVRASLANGKTISVTLKPSDEHTEITEEHVQVALHGIAEKAKVSFPDHSDGLHEELQAKWALRHTRKAAREASASIPKEKKVRTSKKAKAAAESASEPIEAS